MHSGISPRSGPHTSTCQIILFIFRNVKPNDRLKLDYYILYIYNSKDMHSLEDILLEQAHWFGFFYECLQ